MDQQLIAVTKLKGKLLHRMGKQRTARYALARQLCRLEPTTCGIYLS